MRRMFSRDQNDVFDQYDHNHDTARSALVASPSSRQRAARWRETRGEPFHEAAAVVLGARGDRRGHRVRPGRARSGDRRQVARGRLPAAHQDGHRAGDLRHGRDRHRLAGRHGPRRWTRAAGARLLPVRDGRRARARPAGGQSDPARRRASTGAATASGAEAAKEKIAEAAGSGTGFTGFITDDLLPTLVRPAVRGERDPARADHRDPRRRGRVRAGAAPARAGASRSSRWSRRSCSRSSA